jgi:predicted MFS family arabinose efflux permease
VILAFQGVGSVFGGLIALRLHPRRPLVAATLLCVPIALMLALLGAAAPVPVLCLAGLLASVGLTCGDIIWFTTFQLEVPDHLMSRLSSFDWFGSVALNPLGFALVGPLATLLGVATTLYVAAALNAVISVTVALTPAVRRLERRPRADPVTTYDA